MDKIGPYSVCELLQSTHSASIYRAVHDGDGQRCILKMAMRNLTSFKYLAGFRTEYDVLKDLKVEGVVEVVDYFQHEGMQVIAFGDIEGISLRQYLQAGPLAAERFFDCAIAIISAIGRIHEQGVVHRDINPSNIIINPATMQMQIIDFGAASRISCEKLFNPGVDSIEGTPAYLSPEQTGRLNRGIDYRSDFYSLGITLYEMIAGAPPFISDDLMEYIHFHIARMPAPPQSPISGFPAGAASIVMKLIQKNPEERYQTSSGIISDLQRCRDAWRAGGSFDQLSIGVNEISDRFIIPSRLFGREEESAVLHRAFEQTVNEKPIVLFIGGQSGVGKSAIVHEILPLLTKKQGYFIEGKFELLKRTLQFAPLMSAARQFLQGILSESEERLAMWKERIAKSVGANAAVLAEVIPEIETILGTQPKVIQLPALESRNRFNNAMKNLIATFASKGNPLVLFIDDLQWADRASLELLEFILTAPQMAHCLFIGAYREDEIGLSQPGSAFVEKMRGSDLPLHSIALKPLSTDATTAFLADMLFLPRDEVAVLARLCHEKTEGNPFFLIEFMNKLYQEQQIGFDYTTRRWVWQVEAIRQQHITDNVAELLSARLQTLPPQCIEVLKCAACIGSEFDLYHLSIIAELAIENVACSLNEAIHNRLVMPRQGGISLSSYRNDNQREARDAVCRFVHDRVFAAASSLLDAQAKAIYHERIAKLLLQSLTPQEQESAIGEIANHLNKGTTALEKKTSIEYAEIHFRAGCKAMDVAAFSDALEYFRNGIAFLPPENWTRHYKLSIELYTNAIRCATIYTMDEEMEQYAGTALAHVQNPADAINIHEIRLYAYTLRHRLDIAFDLGIEVLADFGIHLPRKPSVLSVIWIIIQLRMKLTNKNARKILDATPCENPLILSILNLMRRLNPVVYMINPRLLAHLTLKSIQMTHRYGYSSSAISTSMSCGLILCGIFHNYRQGYQFGQLAIRLQEKIKTIQYQARISLLFTSFIRHWKEPWRNELPVLRDAFNRALDEGDLEYAAIAVVSYSSFSIFSSGDTLSTVHDEVERMWAIMKHYKADYGILYAELMLQVIENLTNSRDNYAILTGTYADEAECLRIFEKLNNATGLAGIFIMKMFLAYFYDNKTLGADLIPVAKKYLTGVRSHPFTVFFTMFESLIYCDRYPHVSDLQKFKYRKMICRNQRWFKKLAQMTPANFQHKWALVEAEYCRITGRYSQAVVLYNQAIKCARQNGFVNDAALAYELVADFHLSQDDQDLARYFYGNAIYEYLRWGATAKAEWLKKRHDELLRDSISQSGGATTSLVRGISVASTHSDGRGSYSLDLQSILKAASAVNRSLKMESLLESLITILMENAGAQRCTLCLTEKNGLVVQACGSVESAVRFFDAVPVEAYPGLPRSIVNVVKRTHNSVVIEDARQPNTFSNDPYFASHAPRSILCAPLMNQNRLSGIYYLENDLANGAFHAAKIEILNILSSQAGIAFENARLYDRLSTFNAQLEKQVQERTRQLIASQKNITDIMNNIGSAIFTFNADLGINEEHSRIAEHLFGTRHFGGKRLSQLLEMTPQVERSFTLWVRLVLSHTISKNWPRIERLAPVKEAVRRIDGREIFLRINYEPIYENNAISRIMLIAADITDQKNAERFLEQSQREKELLLERVQTLVENRPDAINSLLSDTERLVTALRATSPDALRHQEERLREIRRESHNLKGVSGSFGLCGLPGTIERLEDLMAQLVDEHTVGAQRESKWKQIVDALATEVEAIKALRAKLFFMRENRISIDRDEYTELIRKVRSDSSSGATRMFLKDLIALNSVTLEIFCQRYNKIIQAYCNKYPKQVNPLAVITPREKLSPQLAQYLETPVTHIIRNCLDHGIEDPATRLQSGKPAAGTISIECQSSDTGLSLVIRDDGKGLDPEAIGQSALRKGFVSKEQLASMSVEQKQEMILLHGFSTKDSVNDISGRGVGMDAVKMDIEKLHGSLTLTSTVGSGSTFTISLPIFQES